MPKSPDASSKAADGGLDVSNYMRVDTDHSTQAQPEDAPTGVKPEVSMEPMTTNVTVPVQRIKHLPGSMTVITTKAGQLIVPVVAFVEGKAPDELAPDEVDAKGDETPPGEGTVLVTAAYARSQGLI